MTVAAGDPCPQVVRCTLGPWLKVEGLSPDQESQLKAYLTIANPKVEQYRRFAGWAPNNIPRTIQGYYQHDGRMYVARGAGAKLFEIAGGVLEVVGQGRRINGFPMVYCATPRPDQAHCVEAMAKVKQATMVGPCGSGKTEVGLQLTARFGVRTLIIVHTNDLLDQWKERINVRLPDAREVAWRFRRKPVKNGRSEGWWSPSTWVTVATVQALKANNEWMTQLYDWADMVIVDECHHTPATTFTEVLAKLNPWRQYGLTATMERADGLTPLIEWHIGPKVAEIATVAMQQTGSIMRAKVFPAALNHVKWEYQPKEPGEHLRMLNALTANQARLAEIEINIRWCFREYGGTHLVLSQFIEYATRIFERLRDAGMRVALVHGGLPKKDRRAALELTRTGHVDVLVATTIADEGLDLPNLKRLHLVTPMRSTAKTIQRVGRICRVAPGDLAPIVWDYVDVGVGRWARRLSDGEMYWSGTLQRQFRSRLKAYRAICDVTEDAAQAVLKARPRDAKPGG